MLSFLDFRCRSFQSNIWYYGKAESLSSSCESTSGARYFFIFIAGWDLLTVNSVLCSFSCFGRSVAVPLFDPSFKEKNIELCSLTCIMSYLKTFLLSLSPQNRDYQDHSFVSALSQWQSALEHILTDFQTSHLQQALNQRKLHSMGQSSRANRSSSHCPQTLIQQDGAQVGTSHAAGISRQRQWLAYQAALQQGRQAPSVPVLSQTSRAGNSLPVTDNGNRGGIWEQRENIGRMSHPRAVSLVDSTSEKNQWPRGRMRGSLSGPAYSAYSQFIIQPTQPAQTARPPTNSTPPANSVTPQQQISVANSRNAGSPHIPSIHR